MTTILQSYAKRLLTLDEKYSSNKISKKILEKELNSVARDLKRLAKSR